MSDQIWHIQGPGNAYTPDEMACITRAAQAFLDVVSAVGAPQSHHGVVLDDLVVIPGSIKVNWPQPGDAVIQLAPCPVCGRRDWPEGGQRAARDIHMRAHERQGQSIPEHLEGGEVAQWLADHPDHRLIKP